VAARREVPFYDRDGEHWLTVEIGVDDAGEPPELVRLAGPEEGRGLECQFRRERRPGADPPWVYVEVSRTWLGEPAPGSADALQRLLESKKWPL
jgi:hypothetical protein